MNTNTQKDEPSPSLPDPKDISDRSWLLQVADDPLGPFAIAHHPATLPKKEEPKG